MSKKTWVVHDMGFCTCGWERDLFLNCNNPTAICQHHANSCDGNVTREQGRVFKYFNKFKKKE